MGMDDAELKRRYGEYGSIRVEVWREFGHRDGNASTLMALEGQPGPMPIPERAIKGQGIDIVTQ